MANISEEDLVNDGNEYVDRIREYATKENAKVITVSAKIEEELSELEDEERDMVLSELGVSSGGLDKLITATYSLIPKKYQNPKKSNPPQYQELKKS